jgi:hypothetical protein
MPIHSSGGGGGGLASDAKYILYKQFHSDTEDAAGVGPEGGNNLFDYYRI